MREFRRRFVDRLSGRAARDPQERAIEDLRLRQAEKDVRWLRNLGIFGWLFVLLAQGHSPGLTPVWIVYADAGRRTRDQYGFVLEQRFHGVGSPR